MSCESFCAKLLILERTGQIMKVDKTDMLLRYKPTGGPDCSTDDDTAEPASSSSWSCCSSLSAAASLSSASTASSSMSQSSLHHVIHVPTDFDSLQDSFRAMRRQADTTYKCNDYILRRRRLERPQDGIPSSSSSIDIACREKMALWSYRIIDHFDGDREIVAISLNYLDRFLNLCSCDRSAFKLAAITSLHLATKLFSTKYITMKSLSLLSKGEFDEANLKEMEEILLKTLDYRLHPPTTKCYIDHMMALMPPDKVSERSRHIIRQRAHFLSELAILDYSLSIDHPATIAFAAVMNASEGFGTHCIDYHACSAFIAAVEQATESDFATENTYAVRDRLWNLYSHSEEAEQANKNNASSTSTSTPMETSPTNSEQQPPPPQAQQQSPRSSMEYFSIIAGGVRGSNAYSPLSILFEGGYCHTV